MALERYTNTTEFDILKSSHKFLRPEDEDDKQLSWDDKLAKKYYTSLYKEFAVCDLKHYKTGNFPLRWRTEDEVLSGAGDSTCGNTRCKRHSPDPDDKTLKLKTVELPFAYVEHGEAKSALVKVVLCARCIKKLLYKRTKNKEQEQEAAGKEEAVVVKKEEDLDDDAERLNLRRRVRGVKHNSETTPQMFRVFVVGGLLGLCPLVAVTNHIDAVHLLPDNQINNKRHLLDQNR